MPQSKDMCDIMDEIFPSHNPSEIQQNDKIRKFKIDLADDYSFFISMLHRKAELFLKAGNNLELLKKWILVHVNGKTFLRVFRIHLGEYFDVAMSLI